MPRGKQKQVAEVDVTDVQVVNVVSPTSAQSAKVQLVSPELARSGAFSFEDGTGSAAAAAAGDAKPGNSIFSSVLNLANTIMGTGILALPYALSGSGVVLGIAFLFLSCAFGILSLHLLSESARAAGRPATFYSVCEAAFPGLSMIVDVIVVFNGFLACLSFMIVASDSFGKTFPVLISLIVILFSFDPDDQPLLQPCPQAVPGTPHCGGSVTAFARPLSTLRSFATFVIAFTCQQNIFAITNELEDPTPRRALLVVVLALSLALTLYLVVGFAGYLTFGDLVTSDILEGYPQNALVDVARCGIAIVVITCYPLQAFAVRTSLGTIVKVVRKKCGRADNAAASAAEPTSVLTLEPSTLAMTGGFLGVTTVLALFVKELGSVVDLNGSIAGSSITFIVPGLVFYLLYFELRRSPIGYGALAMLGFGFVLVPTSLAVAFIKDGDARGAASTGPLVARSFVPYFSYHGPMNVSGTVGPVRTVDGETQTFPFALTGVDPKCAHGAGHAKNSCGVHIHNGTSCSADAGGHFYVASAVQSDPWTHITYVAIDHGGRTKSDGFATTADGNHSVTTGATEAGVRGRALIVHAHDGSRVACALLQPDDASG